MSDNNQQIIEALENLQTKFKDHGRYVSADLIQEEIDNLKPKPQYSVGKAYIIKDTYSGLERSAIYLGDNTWSLFSVWSNKMIDYELCEGNEVYEVAKDGETEPLQTVTTVEELDALPSNTIIRSHSLSDIKDVAIKGLAGYWWQDGYERSRPPRDILLTRAIWDVISLG